MRSGIAKNQRYGPLKLFIVMPPSLSVETSSAGWRVPVAALCRRRQRASKRGIGLYGGGCETFGRKDFKLAHHHMLRVLQHVAMEHVAAAITFERHDDRAGFMGGDALGVLPPPAEWRRGASIVVCQDLKLDQMQVH